MADGQHACGYLTSCGESLKLLQHTMEHSKLDMKVKIKD